MTLAVGQRPGAEAAIDVAITAAERRGVPLRLVSLVELDAEGYSGENIIMIVGSSRLAEKNKLFIGSTAHKVLLGLPVPMVVVPRDYTGIKTSTAV